MLTPDYEEADDRGYFKLDFLNVSLYKDILSEEQLNRLLHKEPLWDPSTYSKNRMTNYSREHSSIPTKVEVHNDRTTSGNTGDNKTAKRHPIDRSWPDIMKEVGKTRVMVLYYFKKAHAVAYAHAIVVQMNLICENLKNENN